MADRPARKRHTRWLERKINKRLCSAELSLRIAEAETSSDDSLESQRDGNVVNEISSEDSSNLNETDDNEDEINGNAENDNENGAFADDNENNSDEHVEIGAEDDGDKNIPFNVVENNDNEANGDEDLLAQIRQWAMRGVSTKKIDQLLAILRPICPQLPKSYKTLLKPHRKVQVEAMGDGLFWYKGLKKNIQQRLTAEDLAPFEEIVIDIGIDGLEIQKTSCTGSMWPILGSFVGLPDDKVFIVAVYHGEGKPPDPNQYLEKFVEEVGELQTTGICIGARNFPVKIRNYLLDAQARSFIKCIVPHNSTFGCEKCEVRGLFFRGREIFEDLEARLRTDESFLNRSNPEHHNGDSLLEAIGTGMVSQFRLDALHLVYIGVWKRFIKFLIGTRRKRGMLSEATVNVISTRIDAIKPHIPRDFNRRPRNLDYVGKYRATEWRRLLLYDGLVVLRDLLPAKVWKCYLLLYTGITILTSPVLINDYTDLAEYCLKKFVSYSARVLGRHFVVYNVHSLIHMASECRLNNGTLETFSTFKYESYMAVIKNALRSTYLPLQQLANRDKERMGHMTNKTENPLLDNEIILSHQHSLNDNQDYDQYHAVAFGGKRGTTLKVDEANSCFRTKKGEIVMLRNIVRSANGRVALIGQKFSLVSDYFDFPCKSSVLGIHKVSVIDGRLTRWKLSEYESKCVLLPHGDEYVSIPLLHT